MLGNPSCGGISPYVQRRPGHSEELLTGKKQLLETQRIHVCKTWSARRKVRDILKIQVKAITPGRWIVNGRAAFKYAGRLAGIVKISNGTLVVQSLAAPIFEHAQEIVHAAISAKVLRNGIAQNRTCRSRLKGLKGHVGSSHDSGSVVGGCRRTVARIGGRGKAFKIGPAVGKQRDSISHHRSGNMASAGNILKGRAPGRGRVIVAQEINRILSRYGKAS